MHSNPIQIQECATADELWHALSPTQQLFSDPSKLIFRGQANANWGLVPPVLRNPSDAAEIWGLAHSNVSDTKSVSAEQQVIYEHHLLRKYVGYCDQIGVRLPGIRFVSGTAFSSHHALIHI